MHKGTQGAAIDNEPGDESAELRGREEVYFEHSNWVGPNGLFEEAVDAEFGDCRRVSSRKGKEMEEIVRGIRGDEHSRRIRSQSSLANFSWLAFFWK